MIKKYLTTPEEILALKDTDTKIYMEDSCNYYRFVNGCLCWFDKNGDFDFNATMSVGEFLKKKYILVEEPVMEVTEEDIGKLCWFWDFDDDDKQIGVLVGLDMDSCADSLHYRNGYTWYQHCRRLAPAEVAKIAGYKVEG